MQPHDTTSTALTTREYGIAGPTVIAIHGGPAAAGTPRQSPEGSLTRFVCLNPGNVDRTRPLVRSRSIGTLPTYTP